MLNSYAITGRTDAHVAHVPEFRCALHPQVVPPLLAMREAARSEGIELDVVSGFRDFERQVAIWNAKYRGERRLLDRDGREIDRGLLDERTVIDAILIWSALPGASRHHWGSDFDVIDRASLPPGYQLQLTAHEFAAGGIFGSLNAWLSANMSRFGFFRPYATDRGGVMPEAWHLSYAPVSVPALQTLTLEVLIEAIAASSMHGREQVLARLPELYDRFVCAVDSPV